VRPPTRHDPAVFAPRVPVLGEARMTNGRDVDVAMVVYGRPVLHRLPRSAVPGSGGTADEYYGLWIAIDLVIAHRLRCTAFHLRVGFDDPEVVGVDVRGADHQKFAAAGFDVPGWAERLRVAGHGTPAAWASASLSGVGEGIIGLFAGDFDPRGPALPESYTLQAIVRAPRPVPELTGTLRVDASFVARRRKPQVTHARTEGTQPFTVQPVGGPAADAAGVRLCLAADIERFSRFANPDAVAAQERLVACLARARRHAGIDEELVIMQEAGDGQFAILPLGLDESVVIPRLVEGLRDALADANAGADDQRRIRVRIALHRGHVAPGANGWIGNATIAVHRLLDSAPARAALAEHLAADFALIVPDSLFTDVIAHHYGRLAPESFEPVDVEIPAKAFTERAWVHVPAEPA
jgi:hypothetical protein